ncbi:unnamed protein product [Bursaphelenchus xylophilus]|uniref:(pine wood nematode) hypothetical protein n=1 Tax=Bursaphelenchus xylophilus TaxID=6326 RepID=A0A1I7RVQ7_BURXY|nr:unnamed protein product [Bursaphelenchus xylophilus]CAG9082016.1 unnamed protein product [Bursaphelenchus xylophilus]
MDRASSSEAIRDSISQLYNTGVTFAIELLGSVSVESSFYSEETSEQKKIGEKLIKEVVDKVHKGNGERAANIDDVHEGLTIIQSEIDLNVTHKSVLIIDSNNPKILRFKIEDISLIVPGEDELNEYFCLFAKCVDDDIQQRKCFVFHAGKEKPEVCQVLKLAFSIAEGISRSSSAKSESSGYSTASSRNSRRNDEDQRSDDNETGRVRSVSDLIHFYQTRALD